MFVWTLVAPLILFTAGEAVQRYSNRSAYELRSTSVKKNFTAGARNSSDDGVSSTSMPSIKKGNVQRYSNRSANAIRSTFIKKNFKASARNSSDDGLSSTSMPSMKKGNADNLTLAEEVELIDDEMKKDSVVDTGAYERMGSFMTMSNFLHCLDEVSQHNTSKRLFECTNMFAIRPQGMMQNAQKQLGGAHN